MPVNRAVVFQLGLLLLIVPAQYIITQWKPVTNSERTQNLQKLILKITTWKNKVLSMKTWKHCYDTAIKYMTGNFEKYAYPSTPEDDADMGESPAVEVLMYKDKTGHFAASTEPRTPRPTEIKFRVGQVIRHKIWGYRGVIIGWDETAKASEEWFKQMHGGNKHWGTMPNYSILVDTRDRLEAQSTYIPEENIEIIKNTKIMHPEIDEYFEMFDGTRYLARPWLKTIYPHDQ